MSFPQFHSFSCSEFIDANTTREQVESSGGYQHVITMLVYNCHLDRTCYQLRLTNQMEMVRIDPMPCHDDDASFHRLSAANYVKHLVCMNTGENCIKSNIS